MKKSTFLLVLLFISINVFSQGTITGFTISPASPTTTDSVKIYVDCMFTSGNCLKQSQSHNTNGFYTDGWAEHCLGMLTVICNAVDTFNLGLLPAGNHSFRFTLDVGYGSPICSPGIVPDDIDSVHFTVSTAIGINEAGKNTVPDIFIYPNPINNMAFIKINKERKVRNAELQIIDNSGKIIAVKEDINANDIIFERNNIAAGMYIYKLLQNGNVINTGKLIMQ